MFGQVLGKVRKVHIVMSVQHSHPSAGVRLVGEPCLHLLPRLVSGLPRLMAVLRDFSHDVFVEHSPDGSLSVEYIAVVVGSLGEDLVEVVSGEVVGE